MSDKFTISQPYISYYQRVFDSFSFAVGKAVSAVIVFICALGFLITHSISFLFALIIVLPLFLGVCFLLGSIYSKTFLKEVSIGEKVILKTFIKDVQQEWECVA